MKSLKTWTTFSYLLPRALPLASMMFAIVCVIAAIRGTNATGFGDLAGRFALVFLLLWVLALSLEYAALLKQLWKARQGRVKGMPGHKR